ncbi:MAG: Hsp20/alpha crystallin family protein [Lentisphaerae bacterium]|nr:Hsp20/alpha crystallin family protein [Lentisphaerota bacterium]
MKTAKEVEKTRDSSQAIEDSRNTPVLLPAVDIIETGAGFVVYADMPGVDESSVSVSLDKGILTLSVKRESSDFKDMRLTLRETESGIYERSFSLSEGIDRSKITANLAKGVLKIVLPRSEAEQPRKIRVQAS